jgi:hypothetical protein
MPAASAVPRLALCEIKCMIEHPCNRLAHLTCGSRKTYIERLNSAVPHDVSPQPGRRPADDDVVVHRYTLCPQRSALRGAVGSVVLERNGRGMASVARVGAHATSMSPMVQPVGRDYAIALWSSSGGLCTITSRRWSAGGVRLKARRLHPFTVACGWRVREGQRQSKGRVLSDSIAQRDVRGRWSGWSEGMVCGLQRAAQSASLPSGFDDDVGSDGGARLAKLHQSTSQMMSTRAGSSRHLAGPWIADAAESGSTSGQFGKSGLPSLRADEDSQNISSASRNAPTRVPRRHQRAARRLCSETCSTEAPAVLGHHPIGKARLTAGLHWTRGPHVHDIDIEAWTLRLQLAS